MSQKLANFRRYLSQRSKPRKDDVRDWEQLEQKLRCLGQTLFWLNICYVVIALGMCAGSIYLLTDKIVILEMINNTLLEAACWLLIIASGSAIIISVIGSLAAFTLSRSMLFIYAGAVTLIILLATCCGMIALNIRLQFDSWAISEMSVTLKEFYGVDQELSYNQQVTYAWDKGQQYMSCCGVAGDYGWEVYRSTRWHRERPGFENILYQNDPTVKFFVPQSCCVKDEQGKYVNLTWCQQSELGPPGIRSGLQNEGLYYQDCYSAMKDFIYKYSAWLAGLGLGAAVILIAGLVTSTWIGLILPTKFRG